jgi:uncharacterized membrane protein YkoI
MKLSSTQRSTLLTVLLVACLAMPADFYLAAREFRVAQNALSGEQRLISENEAAAIALRQTGGKVLSVNLKGGKNPFYQVKVLLESKRVKTLRIDARSGKVRR